MRDYRFRGKRVDNKEWVYGYYICVASRAWIKDVDDKHSLQKVGGGKADFRCIEVDPSTVGQYIGLKDENGKEVYEGDRVRVKVISGNGGFYELEDTIVYDINHAMFDFKEGLSFMVGLTVGGVAEIEVIGNIHDNPELMEVAK